EANGESFIGRLSADGRYVTFESHAGNLEPGGGTGIFIHDRQTGTTSPIAVVPPSAPLSEVPLRAKIRSDPRFVGFEALARSSQSTTLRYQIFLVDRQTLARTRLSVSTAGVEPDLDSDNSAINGDGSVVTFGSNATNLVSGDTNGQHDVFVRTISGN